VRKENAFFQRQAAYPFPPPCCFRLACRNCVGDMEALGIYESLQLKRQVLLSASEAAEMIVRVDEVVQCAPRERVPEGGR